MREGADLPTIAQLAPWATPCAATDSRSACNETAGRTPDSEHHSGQTLTDQIRLLSVTPRASPTVRDHKDSACEQADVPVNALLGRQAAMLVEGWPTPEANTSNRSLDAWYQGTPHLIHSSTPPLAVAAQMVSASGTTTESSPAATARRAASRLNPAFSRWLMGFDATWDRSSPGWNEWDTIRRLLALYYEQTEKTAPGD